MVFFTCNACGEALKKNQVEKHTYQCRRCESLSCADCGKDFWGNDYQQHVKCVSEAEKYGGKNFKPKANANKGEQKQNLWVEQVQRAVENCNANPRLRAILQTLVDYPNIPRKEAKFKNFLSNSLRVNDSRLAQSAWDYISAELKKDEEQKPAAGAKANGSNNKDATANDEEPTVEQNGSSEAAVEQKTLNKRERKEERRKKAHREEKKDAKQATNGDSAGEERVSTAAEKKVKKRKRGDSDEEEEEGNVKRHRNGNSAIEEAEPHEDAEEEEAPAPMPSKFHWNSVLVRIVTEAGGEIKLKKLQRKVLALYSEQGGDPRDSSDNAALAKFMKRLEKHRRLKVENSSVSLLESL